MPSSANAGSIRTITVRRYHGTRFAISCSCSHVEYSPATTPRGAQDIAIRHNIAKHRSTYAVRMVKDKPAGTATRIKAKATG